MIGAWYRWRKSVPSFVIAGMLLAFGDFSHRLALRSRAWPVTSGVITQSYVRTKHDNLVGRTIEKGVTITYRYTAGGRTYYGSTVSFGEPFGGNAAAVQRFPAGAVVDVHYDPDHPDLSVLEPGGERRLDLGVLLGVVLVVYGVWTGLR